ncbi:MAG: GH3 auxin-responsive promoter family protein [Chlorobi bacterium]|nr:GH3 auxin-responsive promoter family protein [Chlorobiota bacterium]
MTEDMINKSAADAWEYFSGLCENPEKAQQSVLGAILKNAAGCRFLNKYGITSSDTVDSFRKKMPLSSWVDYKDLSEEMQLGAENILFPGKPVAFLATSGTSGLKKLIPETELGLNAKMVTEKLRRLILSEKYPEVMKGKLLPLINKAEISKTPAGIPIGSASGTTAKSASKELIDMIVFPFEVLDIEDQFALDYVIMRFALEDDIRLIMGNNIARMAKLTDIVKENYAQIIDDIEKGTISEDLNIEPALRDKLVARLKPNRERADELKKIAERGDEFIPANYWRNLKLIFAWLSGSIGSRVEELKPLFGEAEFIDVGYGASEGKFNIPRSAGNPAGVLALHGAFFEFIPYNTSGRVDEYREGEILLAHQLKKGEMYEMVITNYAGLYRYNMHDIIKVTGFYRNTPEIVFISKTGDVGDIAGERLAGSIISRVVPGVLKRLNIKTEHVCAVTVSSPPHYIFCVELSGEYDLKKSKTEEIAEMLDAEFRKEVGYGYMRRDNLLLKPEVRFMKPGWKDALFAEKVSAGNQTSQIKLNVVYKEEIPGKEFVVNT